mmetsp:Transcript_9660/g.18866  ORF Transcript_9660/g.18866 Transcript_9660/m.18866 type:complete len:217 (+) Transcript_9660:41-691(+)
MPKANGSEEKVRFLRLEESDPLDCGERKVVRSKAMKNGKSTDWRQEYSLPSPLPKESEWTKVHLRLSLYCALGRGGYLRFSTKGPGVTIGNDPHKATVFVVGYLSGSQNFLLYHYPDLSPLMKDRRGNLTLLDCGGRRNSLWSLLVGPKPRHPAEFYKKWDSGHRLYCLGSDGKEEVVRYSTRFKDKEKALKAREENTYLDDTLAYVDMHLIGASS